MVFPMSEWCRANAPRPIDIGPCRGRTKVPKRTSSSAPTRLRRMTSVHLLHAGYADDRVGSSVVLVRDGDARIVVDPGMVARRAADPRPARRARREPGVRDPRLPVAPPPRPHDQRGPLPERRGGRLLGALRRRRVARPRRRRPPPVAARAALADAGPHGRGRLADRGGGRRGLRDDPSLVARRPQPGGRPVRRRPGRARGKPGARPGGGRHRHPRPRRPASGSKG